MRKSVRSEKPNRDDDQSLSNVWIHRSPLTKQLPNNTTKMYLFNLQDKKYTTCNSFEDASKIILSGSNICEHFNGYVKPYINYEKYISYETYINDKSKYDESFIDMLNDIIIMIRESMTVMNYPVLRKDILICDGSRQSADYFKISYHFVVNSHFRFSTPEQAKRLVNKIYELFDKNNKNNKTQNNRVENILYYKKIDGIKVPTFDSSVYEKIQSYQCIHNSEQTDKMIYFLPIDSDKHLITRANTKDYLVSYHNHDDVEKIKMISDINDEESKIYF